jgi:hypothetical protein
VILDHENFASLESIPGLVLQMTFLHYRNANGNLYVRYLYWNGDEWCWNYNWLDNDWNGNNPAAAQAILLVSLQLIS